MIKIGRRLLIANFPQLQIPLGETAKIDLDVYGWKFNLEIEFDDIASEQAIQVRPAADGVRLVFQKWDNILGVGVKTPVTLAKLATGGALDFLAANYRLGELNVFSLQLLHDQEAK